MYTFNVSKQYTEDSMYRSHRWADRCIQEFNRLDIQNQALYGIIQGGIYKELREKSIEFNITKDFFGIAIGGSLGSDKQTMYNIILYIMNNIRSKTDKPVHLLGIGGVSDIFFGIRCGIDTFDCVHPTRLGRHGAALVKAKYWINNNSLKPKESIDLKKNIFKNDNHVIDDDCKCPTCSNGYTRMYINYLLKLNESLAGTLLTMHNIFFMNELMEDIRNAIINDNIDEIENKWLVDELKYYNRTSMNISCDHST